MEDKCLNNNPKIDRIYKQRDGTYQDQAGSRLDIKESFKNGRLYCFSGKEHPLIVTEWNVNAAMFFVIGNYRKGKGGY